MAHFITTYQRKVTRQQAATINRRIAAIDADAVFVRHYEAGNSVHGWLERPDDGWNTTAMGRENNRQLINIANEVLGVETRLK